jgi:hypothetical protein
MIDTDKYEGHTVNRRDKLGTYKGNDIFVWDWFAQQLPTWASNADYHLLADAPLLLAEVKRLREQVRLAKEWIAKQYPCCLNTMDIFTEYIGDEEE